MNSINEVRVKELEQRAASLRRHVIKMIFAAGSGHPGGSLSAADIVTALFFEVMDHSPQKKDVQDRDHFILSKGHAAPIYYAALAECGYFPVDELMTLRKLHSRLQGHPSRVKTPGVEMSTGSLGQGLSVANGLALALRLQGLDRKVYCLCGDGEMAEGQVWEAAMFASHYHLDNVIAIVDRNGLQIDGRTEDVMALEPLADKWKAFGWNVLFMDGNDMWQVLETLNEARQHKGGPTVIVAKTVKGKGVSFMENNVGFHGKSPNQKEYEQAMRELGGIGVSWAMESQRKNYGKALVELGKRRKDLVVLDADLSGSTRTVEFKTACPERFFNCGIAEQNMMGTAAGLAVGGMTVFASTFAVFATGRAYDQVRQSIAYPDLNVKIVASHAGITVGGDGASHQTMEDIALMNAIPNMTVIVPADGPETYKAVLAVAERHGPAYVRMGRSDVPVITSPEDRFEIGKASILRDGSDVALVGVGQMVAPCLLAADALKARGINARVIDLSTIKPLDVGTLEKAARDCGCLVTAEEHNIVSGVGTLVAAALAERYPTPMERVAMQDVFGQSGESDELMREYGLSEKEVIAAAIKVTERKK